jgi:hypothetical protein
MIETPRIAYRARNDATPDAEISALAAIYKLCISKHVVSKNAGGASHTAGDDAMKGSSDDRARNIIQESR